MVGNCLGKCLCKGPCILSLHLGWQWSCSVSSLLTPYLSAFEARGKAFQSSRTMESRCVCTVLPAEYSEVEGHSLLLLERRLTRDHCNKV